MDNEKDPTYIFHLGNQIKTDAQAVDHIRYLINKSAPSWGSTPGLAKPDEIKTLLRLIGDICVVLSFVREDENSQMAEAFLRTMRKDEALNLVRSLRRDPTS